MTTENQQQKSATQVAIEADMKAAMIAKDKKTVGTLRMVVSDIQLKAKDLRVEFASDQDAIGVVEVFKKKLVQELEGAQQAGRAEKATDVQAEIALVDKYIPAKMSKEEIEAVVMEIVAKLGDQANMGTVMKEVRPQLQGKADNSLVSQVVKEQLNK